MMRFGRLLACTALVIGAACRDTTPPPMTATPPTTPPPSTTAVRDPHSAARPEEARVTHVALDLVADFAAKTLAGTATLTLARSGSAPTLVLDTADLNIVKVTDAAGHVLGHALGAKDAVLGQPLTITLTPEITKVVVEYRTSPQAGALQWLSPSQTAGRKQPYLFSQGQAILTRSWLPTQDSPAIRQTYEARITVPAPLMAVMSAERLTPDGVSLPDGRRRFDFRLAHPIPPYLIAIAVGDLAVRPISNRTAVVAEPSVVDRAAAEFADLEKMVAAAEALYGPYRWGRYDVLVMPPSFPFGGMENPMLTFATPTILAGDRSLTSLIAHELAHSWSGNLVTNATWNDFWLNEGFTVYFELRIMEALYGAERMAMLEVLGRRELVDEIAGLGAGSKDTHLRLALAGRNPDDGMTAVAYNKGAALLRLIEKEVGRGKFDAWLRSWFGRRAFTSATTDDFVADLRANLLGHDAALEARLNLPAWLDAPGIPPNATRPTAAAFDQVDAAVQRFAAGTPASQLDTKGWDTQQWLRFLGSLPERVTTAQITDLDRAFAFSTSGNSEILFAWLRIAIRHRYQPAMPALEHFLTSQGRRKFLRPLYDDLMKTSWGPAVARRVYQQARPTYHAVSVATLDTIVK
jgi:leukotriene-A4 hydrolase